MVPSYKLWSVSAQPAGKGGDPAPRPEATYQVTLIMVTFRPDPIPMRAT